MTEYAMRPASARDSAALAAIGRESFVAAFGHLYRAADLAQFLEDNRSTEAVAAQIADPALTHRLAVDAADRILAFASLVEPSPFADHSDAAHPVALGQLYTDPALTGQGLGAALLDWALETARGRGADAMQLSVWSGNARAQKFYARHGFAKIADIDFWVGTQRDDEYLLERRF